MNLPEIKQRVLGLNFIGTMAHVVVWSPFAKKVTLHNETTGEQLELEASGLGYWQLQTDKIADTDLYRFQLDDGQLLPDPASLSQPFGVHGASQAVNLHQYPWTDASWRNPDAGDYIIYELHVGTFTAEGNFKGLERKLDYLVDLGITAVELMPVAQFPGHHNWGYDGVFPFAVQQNYGGVMALQQLVDACHQKGLAVILDVVYNHLGPEGNYLKEFAPYFTDKYKTPWGEAINFDDAYCDPVRRYFIENALMWLRDFHIDALRLDAVHAIRDFSPKHIIKEMNDAVMMLNAATNSNKFLILETDLNEARYIQAEADGGFGVRAQWCDEFHHALRVAAGQERRGYYQDFNGLQHLVKSLKDAYVFTGQYSDERHRNYGTPTTGISGDHFVVFAQNHDQVGNRMLGERLSHLLSTDMQRLIATLVLTSPFIPLLFMGEEWGATTPFQYFIHHSDQKLIDAVHKGRAKEFAGFQDKGTPPPAQDEATFLSSVLQWQEPETGPHAAMLDYYRQLIALRKSHPALTCYDRSSVQVSCDEEKEVLVMERSKDGEKVYALFNFSQEERIIQLNDNAFPLDLAIASAVVPESVYPTAAPIILPAESAIILAHTHVSA